MKISYKLLIASLFFISSNVSATLLTTAGDYNLSGTTVADRPELEGLVLEDLITTFSFTGSSGQSVEGSIQNRVVRSVDGTLDFYWRIFTDSANTADVTAFRVIDFDGFSLDADWRIDGLGSAAPDTARYFGDTSGAVNFLFDDTPLVPGLNGQDSSNFFFLDTNATNYDMSGQFDLLCADTGCTSSLYSTFAPTMAAVPEPSIFMLFGLGLVGLGFARRKEGYQA